MAAATLTAALAACSDDNGPTGPGGAVATLIGADSCGACHAAKFADWQNSGHNYKLTKVTGGVGPTYPNSSVPSPPAGYTWNDISYVIGGYGWKTRFMDTLGYIITGATVQYNLPRTDLPGSPAGKWVAYDAAVVDKPYTCGACHTTGWKTLAENGGVNQDSLVGIHGTWYETGITCERCHGPGSVHAATKRKADINVNRSKDLCGECHFRDVNHGILASGGFIRHHEQFDEMISAKHSGLLCTSCHNPHKGSRYNAATGGIKGYVTSSNDACIVCHSAQAAKNSHNSVPKCLDCHMPRASRTALAVNAYMADLRTHIFKIRTDPVPKDSMFYTDGTNTFARGYLTLDFACYSCHRDAGGVGGPNSVQTLAQLSAKAVGIHN